MNLGSRLGRFVGPRLAALAVLFVTALAFTPAHAADKHVVPDIRGESQPDLRAGARLVRLPLTIHVATGAEKVVFDLRRLNRAVWRANEALRASGIEVYVARVELLPEGFASIRHRRDRRHLAAYAPPDGTVHVFLVGNLELGGALRADRSVRGLHWRYRGLLGKMRNREYLIVSNDAPATTFVHELGHLFGLEHDTSHQNLMCSCRQGPRQIFTGDQGRRMRSGALAFVARQP
ncbi:M12 family metallo-peptidase [Nannocystis punicea]|uniref:M12 family metallo-peptidase n=1 Tax=Nannocystis punicea TaxID=2995304 RepID=A0ABY7H544_9BACT|nr:M12 family metallo-peptidase [Nannocystis poenicansa]WAS94408.1 M12 family metallo-peptidase [Nannocystis poenicansa]